MLSNSSVLDVDYFHKADGLQGGDVAFGVDAEATELLGDLLVRHFWVDSFALDFSHSFDLSTKWLSKLLRNLPCFSLKSASFP